MGGVGVTHKLDNLIRVELQQILEPLANLLKDSLGLFRGPLVTRSGFVTRRASPETDTVESLASVDNDTHDLVVAFLLELLTDRSEKNVHPDFVIGLALLESVCPTTTVLVLWVFPFWAYAGLEKVIVGLWCELGSRSDVVLWLSACLCAQDRVKVNLHRYPRTLQQCRK